MIVSTCMICEAVYNAKPADIDGRSHGLCEFCEAGAHTELNRMEEENYGPEAESDGANREAPGVSRR